MPKDEAQLYAANELYVLRFLFGFSKVFLVLRSNRGWFFHKAQHMWLTRVPNVEPLVKTNNYERGSYIFFDQNNWETTRKVNPGSGFAPVFDRSSMFFAFVLRRKTLSFTTICWRRHRSFHRRHQLNRDVVKEI